MEMVLAQIIMVLTLVIMIAGWAPLYFFGSSCGLSADGVRTCNHTETFNCVNESGNR